MSELEEIEEIHDVAADEIRRGFWHEPDGTPTTKEVAVERWGDEAFEVLSGVAHQYQGLITYGDLAEQVQARSSIRTNQQQRTWMASMLAPVVERIQSESLPPLTALVVNKADGQVGEGYDAVLLAAGDEVIADPDEREKHASVARLECYRWAGSAPADGGFAALAPLAAKRVTMKRAAAKADRPINVCPTCLMAVPATGVCDNCD